MDTSSLTPPLRPHPLPSLPAPVARHVLAIATEALENAHRHASATRVDVRAAVDGRLLRLTIHDDGIGLPPGITLERLRGSGHFSLLGMVERAAQAGVGIHIGRGADEGRHGDTPGHPATTHAPPPTPDL